MARKSRPQVPADQLLIEGTRDLGIELDTEQLEQLVSFLEKLETWNARLNLVGQHAREDLARRHLVDSLAAVRVLSDLGPELRIADLGSGAGLPGIPLAIAVRPRAMVLVEPRRKRASFLRAVRRSLPAVALDVVEMRADELVAEAGRAGSFDAVVSRAALSDPELLEAARTLLRPGGLVVAHRGTEKSGTAVPLGEDQGFSAPRVLPYRLLNPERQFQLLIWEKTRFT